MSAQSLDLKYRPRKFSSVVGNAAVVKLLLARSRGGTLSGRSMMFGGPKGTGKTSLARIVALAIVCDELADGEPCGACTSCQAVLSDGSMVADEFDAATGGTVDRIRSIIEDLEYGTVNGKPRVVILDEAQRLSKAAQDALLKSVEDRRFVLILCTTEPHKIGDAIRSRVEEYPVGAPSVEDMTDRLSAICRDESIRAFPDALTLLCQHLKCCPRECISAVETLSGLGQVDVQSVREYLRYDSYEAVAEVLSLVDSSAAQAMEKLDQVMRREGPSWVRDAIIHAVASSLRQAVGARPTYPVAVSFYPARGLAWSDLARSLGVVDKPSAADIEAALLSGTGRPDMSGARKPDAPWPVAGVSLLVQPPPPAAQPAAQPQSATKDPPPWDVPKPEPVKPELKAAPKAVAVKSPPTPKRQFVEVDGVRFSAKEELTTLDGKIETGTRGVPVDSRAPAGVELDEAHMPLAEREFARGFISRIQKD